MSDRLVTWNDDPASTDRLEHRWREELLAVEPESAQRSVDRLRAAREEGELEVLLWEHPVGWVRGFVACQLVASAGRRIDTLYLEPGARDAPDLASLLDLLERHPGDPPRVFASPDSFLGVAFSAQSRAFAPRGFVHIDHERMVFRSSQAVVPADPRLSVSVRHPVPADAGPLIELYVRAYRTSAAQLLWPQVVLDEDARYYIRGIFGGARGVDPIVGHLSFVAEKGPEIVGAALLSEDPVDGVYLADLMVDPTVRRQGLARHLLGLGLAAVRANRPTADVTLVVETGNDAAVQLYRAIGFSPLPRKPGQHLGAWLRVATVEELTGVPFPPRDRP